MKIYDPNIKARPLHDTDHTQEASMDAATRLGALQASSAKALAESTDVLVVANTESTFKPVVQEASLTMPVIDLVRLTDRLSHKGYQGICW